MPITILLKNTSTPGFSDLPTALALGRSENPGVIGIHNLPLLVDIGLTDLPTSYFPSVIGCRKKIASYDHKTTIWVSITVMPLAGGQGGL